MTKLNKSQQVEFELLRLFTVAHKRWINGRPFHGDTEHFGSRCLYDQECSLQRFIRNSFKGNPFANENHLNKAITKAVEKWAMWGFDFDMLERAIKRNGVTKDHVLRKLVKFSSAGLLTDGNPKVKKGLDKGFHALILMLAPHTQATGQNLCPDATPGCIAACLNRAGHGGLGATNQYATTNNCQRARTARAWLYLIAPDVFEAAITAEIEKEVLKAKKKGLKVSIRLNGTTDLSELSLLAVKIARMMTKKHGVKCFAYDYTKDYSRAVIAKKMHRKNLGHITASYHERTTDNHLAVLLDNGVNVAVCFDIKKEVSLPDTFKGYPVIDGDVTDLRFKDKAGFVVGLRAKGHRIRKDKTGFLVREY